MEQSPAFEVEVVWAEYAGKVESNRNHLILQQLNWNNHQQAQNKK